jgi:hypothetical protein
VRLGLSHATFSPRPSDRRRSASDPTPFSQIWRTKDSRRFLRVREHFWRAMFAMKSLVAILSAVSHHAKPNTDFCARLGQIESNYDEVTDSFDAMNLKAELLRGMWSITRKERETISYIFSRCLRLRFRASFCYPATCYHASHQRSVFLPEDLMAIQY